MLNQGLADRPKAVALGLDKLSKMRQPQRLLLYYSLGLLLGVLCLAGCSSPASPKPRGYARIELPPHSYKQYQSPSCPFTFEYPAEGVLSADSKDSCFVDISFPRYRAKWHITLRHFAREHTTRSRAYEDYRKVVYFHSQKSSDIIETRLQGPAGGGTFFEIYGQVPTSAQFFYTDSLRYAIMAASYFNTGTKNDSLAPIIDHLKADLHHMVQSLRWR